METLEFDTSPELWDREIARLNGHPWQTAHWGRAEHVAHGAPSTRLWLKQDGRTVQMARVEERNRFGYRAAWIRRGPVSPDGGEMPVAPAIRDWLKEAGYAAVVATPWTRYKGKVQPNTHKTIWIDLSIGIDRLWSERHHRLRNAVRRCERLGVKVYFTEDPDDIKAFIALCEDLSRDKGFKLRTSEALVRELVKPPYDDTAEAKLFVAKVDGVIAAGAMIARCGQSIHYMGGSSDRHYSNLRLAEVIHWKAMDWAVKRNCRLYDLEGIDPVGNPGVYAFKKRLGGDEVELEGSQLAGLSTLGKLSSPLVNMILHSTVRERLGGYRAPE
ncbi:MAG: GNAT family N-acetyltransferase [Hyphomicrobiaceae bacterium]